MRQLMGLNDILKNRVRHVFAIGGYLAQLFYVTSLKKHNNDSDMYKQ